MGNCPCHSGKSYEECCKPFHEGALPPTPLSLMRSRYSAYALKNKKYILDTTHPKNKSPFSGPLPNLEYLDLFIIDTEIRGDEGTVTFRAILSSGGKDCSFTEKSRFEKVHGKWLYLDGTIL